jgi:hypothetical protein
VDGLIRRRDVHPTELRRLLRAGSISRVGRGLYEAVSPGEPVAAGASECEDEPDLDEAERPLVERLAVARATWLRDLRRYMAAFGPEVVVAQSAAAALWGLDGFEPPVPITANTPRDQACATEPYAGFDPSSRSATWRASMSRAWPRPWLSLVPA